MPCSESSFASDSGAESALWWAGCVLADVPVLDDWLGRQERARLEGYRFPKRRGDWRLGRWTAKLVLRASGLVPPQTPLPQIEILPAASGAPQVFCAGQGAGCSISLSHSAGVAFCVVSRQPMALGCDLEEIANRDPALVTDYFTAGEAEMIGKAPPADRMMLVNLVWSAKESALKALGEGLRRDTQSVVVAVAPVGWRNGWNALNVTCRETNRVFHGWWRAGNGFVHTVAADRPIMIPVEAIEPS
jgi:4'-phosphopantetheinyl transferase